MAQSPHSSRNTREIEFWNSASTRSWSEHVDLIDRFMQPVTAVLFEHAAPKPGETVIDIGCGSGTTVMDMARRVGPSGRVEGFDVAKLSVERANERIAQSGLTNATVTLADLSTAALASRRYDLAISRFGVMFFTDPAATFAHLHAAMKTGGRLTFAVFRTARENTWASGPVGAVRHMLELPPPPGPEDPGQFSWADPQRVERILRDGGFQNISLTPIDPQMRYAGPGGAEEAADFCFLVGPILRAVAKLTPDQRQEVRGKLVDYFKSVEGPDGIVLPGANWIVKATV